MKNEKQKYFDQVRYLILFGLLGGLFIHGFVKHGILNQAIGFLMPKATAQVPIIESQSGFMPDWSNMKFRDMIIQESGSISFPDKQGTETRTWNAGQSIAEFLELGDFEESGFNLENLQLAQIAQYFNINLDNFQLSDFDLLKWQTLPDLANAIPQIKNQYVENILPLRDFLDNLGIPTNNQIVEQVINSYQLDSNVLGDSINLEQYNLTSIPGIENTPIEKFNDWQDSLIDGIPGLTDLPWSELPNLPNPNMSFIGKVDVVLRDIEANRVRSISGSYQSGFNVPCYQNNCAHAEMAGFGKTTGVQWMSGKYQKVSGGFGILSALNGGKEPTGRHPFGSGFKQVIWDINEAQGSMTTAMFFRICKRIAFVRTCSPYFIGPVPFVNYREKDPIIFGNPNSLP
ncbi:hypothetical protein PN456_17285 [Nodularia spumigena CS-586/05]|uniref:hypothetical protein n=1 Tax=Nodularia spumigena TaxID=70799 RepID=UPI00232FF19A|nr:hypothetical protein [Nodularia spumigena]MDB9344573.1 hypothetical protein [Nodularia spumigena CS-588/06]MDB9370678.1 hypothetical protein [Nodularia spumigena CS-586/05]